jgi:hypothetical protein
MCLKDGKPQGVVFKTKKLLCEGGQRMIKTSEEMLELSKKATKEPWNIFEDFSSLDVYSGELKHKPDGIVQAKWVCQVDDEDASGNDNYSNDAELIVSSREFVPYAAERLIEAERLLKEVVKDGKGISEILLLVKEIKQFVEAIRET